MHPFPNFKIGAVEIWEWISNSALHFAGHVFYYSVLGLKLIFASIEGAGGD